MWQVSCFYLFQIVPRNMAPDNPAALSRWAPIPTRPLFGHLGGHLYEQCHCKWHLTDKQRMKKLENCHIQTASCWHLRYKGIKWGECHTVLWLNHFHTPQHSYARASGEEKLEEIEEERRNAGNVVDIFYALARFHLKERVALHSAQFRLDSSIRPVSTQPPPSLHRQHYCAVW